MGKLFHPLLSYTLTFPVWVSCTLLLLMVQHLILSGYPSLIGCYCGRNQGMSSNVDKIFQEQSQELAALEKSTSIDIENYGVRGPFAWECISEHLRNEYTLEGAIPVRLHELHADKQLESGVVKNINLFSPFTNKWKSAVIKDLMERVRRKDLNNSVSTYGVMTDKSFYSALEKYPVKGLDVLVVGSQTPWVEAFCLAYEAKSITTVDFNVPIVEDPNLIRTLSISDLAKSRQKFDVVVSYSSLEHDGLGRYGDPLNPNGDIERVKRLKLLVNPGGILFLGVPVGKDCLLWNAHRVYGPTRLALLIQGWRKLNTFYGIDKDTPLELCDFQNQPIIVLTPE